MEYVPAAARATTTAGLEQKITQVPLDRRRVPPQRPDPGEQPTIRRYRQHRIPSQPPCQGIASERSQTGVPDHGALADRLRLTHPAVYRATPAQVIALSGGGPGVGDPQVVAQTAENARKQPGDMHLADPEAATNLLLGQTIHEPERDDPPLAVA